MGQARWADHQRRSSSQLISVRFATGPWIERRRLPPSGDRELVVLNVLEKFDVTTLEDEALPSWRRPPDPVGLARKHLLADLGATAGKVTVLIDQGDPVEGILRAVETEQCSLIVIGPAKNEFLGRFSLGRTVDRLLRRSRVPLLVVKTRPRKPYRHIVVATDFSDSSRHALQAATRFFPEQKLTVFHAYSSPISDITADRLTHRLKYRDVVMKKYQAFLERMKKPDTWQEPRVLIEDGSPTFLLRDLVHEEDVDLIVLGSHGHSMILDVFIGSVAKEIMVDVPCDVFLVREPRAHIEV